ncbi:MAG: resolvase [Cyanobacteriota bacterium]|nr:resolvase [Cyanobacteriota bacterium]
MTRVIGFDPGRSKCGLVLVRTDAAQVLDSDVLVPEAVLNTLDQWSQGGNLPMIVMGDGTGSDAWKTPLQKLTTVVQVNERGTTLKARQRYWQLWPPRGLWRLVPEGLRVPPAELDAVAALVMVEAYLKLTCSWQVSPPIKNVRGR